MILVGLSILVRAWCIVFGLVFLVHYGWFGCSGFFSLGCVSFHHFCHNKPCLILVLFWDAMISNRCFVLSSPKVEFYKESRHGLVVTWLFIGYWLLFGVLVVGGA